MTVQFLTQREINQRLLQEIEELKRANDRLKQENSQLKQENGRHFILWKQENARLKRENSQLKEKETSGREAVLRFCQRVENQSDGVRQRFLLCKQEKERQEEENAMEHSDYL